MYIHINSICTGEGRAGDGAVPSAGAERLQGHHGQAGSVREARGNLLKLPHGQLAQC